MSHKTDHSESQPFIRLLQWLCLGLMLLPLSAIGQNPPSILRSETPPDITEKYQANPRFYEVMSAFPNPNSYTRYKFEEVRSAARNDPAMMVILGDHYRIGRSTPADFKKALREYEKAASRGYAMANHRIAYMYADGLGLPKDRDKILHFLKLSADGGYDLAQYDCALIYLNGKFNEPRDFALAYKYLKKAADQNHRLSMESLAMLAHHPASVPAGVPCGLKEALEWYRRAGDTDGERALKEKIGSYGGLRYFLKAIPGFIPGLIDDGEPSDKNHGIFIINTLAGYQDLIGEPLFNTYRREIAENILYRYYFESQQQPDELLRFIVYCQQQESSLSPFQTRYIDAAGRDFRLAINFSDARSLTPFLTRFAAYPRIFKPAEIEIIADRIYVAIMFKEVSAQLDELLTPFLFSNPWVIQNLTARYIAHFENQQFEKHKHSLLLKPYQTDHYLDDVFRRYTQYRKKETDTLDNDLIQGIRLHCLHPYLTDQLHRSLANISSKRSPVIDQISTGLLKAQDAFRTDINSYWSMLSRLTGDFLSGVARTGEAHTLASQIRQLMEQAGKVHLDKLCQTLTYADATTFARLNRSSEYEKMEMMTGNNLQRYLAITQLAARNTLTINSLTYADPNGVTFAPQVTERALPPHGLCVDKTRDHQYRIYHSPAEHLSSVTLEVSNNTTALQHINLWFCDAKHIIPEITGTTQIRKESMIQITPSPIRIPPGSNTSLNHPIPAEFGISDLVIVVEWVDSPWLMIQR